MKKIIIAIDGYSNWWQNHLSEMLSLVAYIALIFYFIVATRIKKEEIEA